MSSTSSDGEVMRILKQGFPNVDFRITGNSANEMQKSIITNIINVTVEYQEDGVENKKFLALKIPRQSGTTAYFDELALFTREVFVYDVLIPRISSYLDSTSLAPICYKTIDSKILILENLTFYHYKRDKNSRLNLEQCLPIVKALADFHASSYKVGQMDPHLLEEEIFSYSTALEMRLRIVAFWEPMIVELLAKNNESSLIPKVKRISLYLKREDRDIQSRIHYSNFKFVVLNHGDFYSDNILLQYDSNNSITGVKIIDYQMSFWSSPVFDFLYFFILSGEIDVIENHFETLLDWYLRCLNERLKKTNCSKVYRQQDFLEDMKTVNFCAVHLVMCRSFISYPLDRTQVLDAAFLKKTEKLQYYTNICLNDELFTRAILSILKLCEKLGLLESSPSDGLESVRQ